MEKSLPQTITPKIKFAQDRQTSPLRIWKKWIAPKEFGGFTLTGFSRAADRTFFHVPELKLGLDCGGTRGRQPETVFLTHSHADHSKDVDYMCQRVNGMDLYCPTEIVSYIDNYIQSAQALNCAAPWDPKFWQDASGQLKYKVHGMKGGDEFEWKKQYQVKIFEMAHSVPCIGYGISTKKKKLKDQFKGLKGKEMGELRKKGIELEDTFLSPSFAYLGDTSITVFDKNPELLTYPIVIVECTFITDELDIKERCVRDGHIYWKQLEPIVLSNPKTIFILIHFSLRYTEKEVMDFFNSLVTSTVNPLVLDNIVVFIGEHDEARNEG